MPPLETTHIFGWTVTHGTHHTGCPYVEMTKEGYPTVGERGEPGIDPEIMLQRLLPRVLQVEFDRATLAHRAQWETRLKEAEQARDDARILRTERAMREQAREQAQREREQ